MAEISISFENNRLLPELLGEQDKNLSKIEDLLNVTASSRGNMISFSGAEKDIKISEAVLRKVYAKLENGGFIEDAEIAAMIRMIGEEKPANGKKANSKNPTTDIVIKTLRKNVTPYTKKQAEYMATLMSSEVIFATGPAGTGKTYLAVAAAVSMFIEGKVDRIILSRPAVEAGENLGFLPGDMRDKVDPYLRPLYDALYDMLPAEKVIKHMETGEIEIAPLAFMRGRTLRHSFVILDEAQNATPVQMKMFLTRLGEGTKFAVTGDLSQTDLPKGKKSGLRDALEKLNKIDEVAVIEFSDRDSVRHPLTAKIVQAYASHEHDDDWKK